MLPRDFNKNCVKIDINPNDDAEDIQAKKIIARQNKKRFSVKP